MWGIVEDYYAQKNVVATNRNHNILCSYQILCNTIQSFHIVFVYFVVMFPNNQSPVLRYSFFSFVGLTLGVTGFFLIIKTIFNIMETTNIITATTCEIAIPVLPICNWSVLKNSIKNLPKAYKPIYSKNIWPSNFLYFLKRIKKIRTQRFQSDSYRNVG